MSANGIWLSNLRDVSRGISDVPASYSNECDAPDQYRCDTNIVNVESGISEEICGL